LPLSVVAAQSIPADAAVVVLATADLDVSAPFPTEGFEGKRGEVCLFGVDGRSGLAVGVGLRSEVSRDVLRHAAGAAARAAGPFSSIAIEPPPWLLESVDGDGIEAITEGLILGAYEYTAFRSSPSRRRLEKAFIVASDSRSIEPAIKRAGIIAHATCFARDLVNEPGGSLTPQRFADIAAEQGARCGFRTTVWDEQTIRENRLGGVLGVNRGSSLPPRFVELSLDAGEDVDVIALCGKGVTFDSGGLSLKSTENMVSMKGDMAGAAAVLGAFMALAELGSSVGVLGFLPLTDNMPGPDATRVGDVLTIRNGKTVEVLNTDAEGRLILADALSVASEHQPAAIIDLATLTGACPVALGDSIAGLMGNDRVLMEKVEAAGEASGEPVWRLPLPEKMRKRLDSNVADLRNVTESRAGGALAAALFLREFVADGIPWAHLDIAGPANAGADDGELVKGGTGFGVRLLLDLLLNWG
jgi:leucyl aminopeptidase